MSSALTPSGICLYRSWKVFRSIVSPFSSQGKPSGSSQLPSRGRALGRSTVAIDSPPEDRGLEARLRPQHLDRLRQRLGDLRRVLAAGLGQVGPAAAAAADDRGDLLEPLAGVEAAGDEVRASGRRRDSPCHRRSETTSTARFVPALRRRTSINWRRSSGVGAIDHRGDDLEVADRRRLGEEFVGGSPRGRFGLPLGGLLLEGLDLLGQRRDPLGDEVAAGP